MERDVALAVRDENDAAHQQTVRLSTEQIQYIAHTEFVPKAMRGKLPQILACIAMGRELGLGDMVALNTIHIIDGKASLSAEAMVSLVRKRGHSIQGNFGDDSCTVTGKRADNGDEMTVTWTREMAEAAGLTGKDNWRKYGASMLWARAVSQLCRMLFADCFAGSAQTPDELGGDLPEDSVGDPQADTAERADAAARSASGETPAAVPPSPTEALASAAQRKKLDVLVGKLRDEAGLITTEMLYLAVPRDDHPWLADDAPPRWRDLRDTLTKTEANALIDRLEMFAVDKLPT